MAFKKACTESLSAFALAKTNLFIAEQNYNIGKKTLVPDQIPTLTSGNTPSDVS